MLLRFAGLCVFVFNEQEHAAQIARTGDGERCVCGAQPALRCQNGVLAGGDECLFAAHQLIQLLGDRLIQQILFRDACRCDDAVAVAHGGADATCRRDALRHVFGAFVQFSHGRVFAEDDAAVFVDENFKRRAFADLHGAAQLFRHHHSPEIICSCQVLTKIFFRMRKSLDFTGFFGTRCFLS